MRTAKSIKIFTLKIFLFKQRFLLQLRIVRSTFTLSLAQAKSQREEGKDIDDGDKIGSIQALKRTLRIRG